MFSFQIPQHPILPWNQERERSPEERRKKEETKRRERQGDCYLGGEVEFDADIKFPESGDVIKRSINED